jgi:spore coat protein U-like protein
MKMKKLVGLAMVLGLVLLTEVAFAGDSNTLTVSANVIGNCKFNSATSTLAFGSLDPNSSSDAAATASVTFWCTKGASYTVSDNNGLHYGSGSRRMLGPAPTDLIPYSLNYTPSTGTGSGKTSAITLNMTGGILNADYVNASAGSYSDTVTLSINP